MDAAFVSTATSRKPGEELEMARTFDIATQSTPAHEFAFAGNQEQRAQQFCATRVFRWRDLRGNVRALPGYVTRSIYEAGMVAEVIGGTTFSHSIVALRPATPDDRLAFESASNAHLRAWGTPIAHKFAFAYHA